ncbi:MAG: hypothetical protein J7L69_01790 [Desulfobulbaceae bacterium]|nr:hypothetical protein [Desulfobulbaceae bacterium]
MNINWDTAGPEGLTFFGGITASISHELNNALAIINENSGLLEDFVLMAKQGMDIDPAKLLTLSSRISSQVQRTETIVGNLNRFAHSVNSAAGKRVNIGPLLKLAAALTARIVAAHEVTVEVNDADQEIELETSPFLFLNLIGRCLEYAAPMTDDEKKITLSWQQRADKIIISLAGLSLTESCSFPGSEGEKAILSALGGTISADSENHARLLTMPAEPRAATKQKTNDKTTY